MVCILTTRQAGIAEHSIARMKNVLRGYTARVECCECYEENVEGIVANNCLGNREVHIGMSTVFIRGRVREIRSKRGAN